MNRLLSARTVPALAAWLATLLVPFAFGACDVTPAGDGLPPEIDCRSCHGGNSNPAPPADLDGETETSKRGVGAHQAHLRDGAIRGAVGCPACHVVPSAIDEPGHVDPRPAEIRFGSLAFEDGATPSWQPDQETCANTYCHGASLSGGQATTPEWTRVDGSQRACDSCHGAPPPAPHPASTNCRTCHPDTVRSNGQIDVAGGKHIDGQVDVGGLACNACHGSQANPAPPLALDGSSDPSSPGVGAHQGHLRDGRLRRAIACEECHQVPAAPDDPGHTDSGLPAELTWGSLATQAGLAPVWDRQQGICANTYCHGASLTGGLVESPEWTRLDGSQLACGACHGSPPPAPHPNRADCRSCHPGTLAPDGSIDLAGGLHIDGQIQTADLACSSCHGSAVNPAPPVSVSGSSDPSDPAVGAHQSHLLDGALRAALACAECHLVPAALDDPGHTDSDLPAELSWGDLASSAGLAPAWDRNLARCANTYCHGASLSGGQVTTPEWTRVDGSQVACGTCHGNPPPPPHPASPACRNCHPLTVAADGSIDVAAGRHIDGQIDSLPLACNSCHGNADNPAPPLSVTGLSAPAEIGVGAHQRHLRDGSVRQAIACDECHQVPADPDDPSHQDGLPAELIFGTLAGADGANPVWDRAQVNCSNTYCHGATLAGGLTTEPIWTLVDGSQTTCASCHGLPPPAPHPAGNNCRACHPETILGGFAIDLRGGKHIDGQVQFSLRSTLPALRPARMQSGPQH